MPPRKNTWNRRRKCVIDAAPGSGFYYGYTQNLPIFSLLRNAAVGESLAFSVEETAL